MYDEETDRRVRNSYARIPAAAEVIPRRSETGFRGQKKNDKMSLSELIKDPVKIVSRTKFWHTLRKKAGVKK